MRAELASGDGLGSLGGSGGLAIDLCAAQHEIVCDWWFHGKKSIRSHEVATKVKASRL